MRCATASYGAILMAIDGAHAFVTYDDDRLSTDNEVSNAAVDNFSSVRRFITDAYDVRHSRPLPQFAVTFIGRTRIEPVSLSHNSIASSSVILGFL